MSKSLFKALEQDIEVLTREAEQSRLDPQATLIRARQMENLMTKKAREFQAVSQWGHHYEGSGPANFASSGDMELDLLDAKDRVARQQSDRDKADKALEAIQRGREVGESIAVRPDAVVSPFKNYKRPVASPLMEVKTPVEIESGVVMPPLPEHKCDIPKAVETKVDKWGSSSEKHDEILVEDRSVFSCICGKDWYVRVTRVPFHASQYDPQYAVKWREIHWYNVLRKAELNKRAEV